MENTDLYCRQKRGSISLEASLAIPVFCVFMLGLMSILQYYALYFATANAAINCAEKLSADSVVFYRLGLDSIDGKIRKALYDLLPEDGLAGDLSTQLAGAAIDKIESSAFCAVIKPLLQKEIDKEIKLSGLPVKAEVVSLSGSTVFENGIDFRLSVRVKSNYLFPNVFTGRKGIYVDYTVRGDAWLYGGNPRYKTIDVNVWDLSNIERGRIIEKEFGSNLPETFPTIDIYDEKTGDAVMLASIDTTAPSYRDHNNLKKTIVSLAKKLSLFEEAEYNGVTVKASAIKRRILRVIVPDNDRDELVKLTGDFNSACYGKYKVLFELRFFQHSNAYGGSGGK